MRDPSRDDNETACRIALQLSGIKPRALAQIPGPLDNRYHFVVRARVRENASAAGYLDPIHPRAAAAGIAEQLRTLTPILVVGRRKPLHLFRRQSDNLFLGLIVPGHCQRHQRGNGYDERLFHICYVNVK